MTPPNDASLTHIVVVGAGFAGLAFVRSFPAHLACITLVNGRITICFSRALPGGDGGALRGRHRTADSRGVWRVTQPQGD